jgi:hypothetical protein
MTGQPDVAAGMTGFEIAPKSPLNSPRRRGLKRAYLQFGRMRPARFQPKQN